MTMLVHTHFTTRLGGVSQPPYDSLNLGAHVGDDPDAVRENRAWVATQLNLDRGAHRHGRRLRSRLALRR